MRTIGIGLGIFGMIVVAPAVVIWMVGAFLSWNPIWAIATVEGRTAFVVMWTIASGFFIASVP